MLKGKHILLGVTGSIAAYKVAMLIRLLVKEGAEVKIIMTQMAKQFITPLTLATLAKNPILVEFYNPENGDWNSHVSLGEWTDLFLIAPASANTIAKMATGVADNLLLTTYLSAKSPVAVAPAMDLDMYKHSATQHNIALLQERGAIVIEPGSGELASGLMGKGRMAEPEEILDKILTFFKKREESKFNKIKVLITAGPTVEQIDPVRFISNNSTGKMGVSIAEALISRGADVTMVCGPLALLPPAKAKIVGVKSAKEMYQETLAHYKQKVDVVIFCAAVADYTIEKPSNQKIKSKGENLTLTLTPTKDIAAEIGQIKKAKTIHIGFALETSTPIDNAKQKIINKNLDAIVVNSMQEEGAGFGHDTNKISILNKNGESLSFPLKSKREVADDIANYIESLL